MNKKNQKKHKYYAKVYTNVYILVSKKNIGFPPTHTNLFFSTKRQNWPKKLARYTGIVEISSPVPTMIIQYYISLIQPTITIMILKPNKLLGKHNNSNNTYLDKSYTCHDSPQCYLSLIWSRKSEIV